MNTEYRLVPKVLPDAARELLAQVCEQVSNGDCLFLDAIWKDLLDAAAPAATTEPPLTRAQIRHLLEVASDFVAKAPHGDNCFLHDDGGEFDRCFCGKDDLLSHIESLAEPYCEDTTPPAPAVAVPTANGIGCENCRKDGTCDLSKCRYADDAWLQANPATHPPAADAVVEAAQMREDFEAAYRVHYGALGFAQALRRDAITPEDYADLRTRAAWWAWRKAATQSPAAQDFPEIALGQGLREVAHGKFEGKHALVFGKTGTGKIGEVTAENYCHVSGQTLAVVTFDNVESLEVVQKHLDALRAALATPAQPQRGPRLHPSDDGSDEWAAAFFAAVKNASQPK